MVPVRVTRSLGATAAVASAQVASAVDTSGSSNSEILATTMIVNGAAGCLIGAASCPRGQEGMWGVLGFVMGATLGEFGIVGIALAALWKKVG